MKIKPNIVFLTGVTLLVVISIFYWFQLRPAQIRGQCDQIAWYTARGISGGRDYYDWKYTQCLHSKGLK